MRKLKIFFVIIVIINISCHNLSNDENKQVPNTVKKYFNSVKNSDFEEYKNLFMNNVNTGDKQYVYSYLARNYDKMNSRKILLNEPEVKDTIMEFSSKHKYVKYDFTNQKNETLTITLFFFSENGYDKITREEIIGNMPKWEK